MPEPQAIADFHACRLGRWIDGQSVVDQARWPEFSDIVQRHQRFHQTARLLVDQWQQTREASRDLFRDLIQQGRDLSDRLEQWARMAESQKGRE